MQHRWLLVVTVICGLAYVFADQFKYNSKTVTVSEYELEKPDNRFGALASVASIDTTTSYRISIKYPNKTYTGDSIIIEARVFPPRDPQAIIQGPVSATIFIVDQGVIISPSITQHVTPIDGGFLVSWVAKLSKDLVNWRGIIDVEVGEASVARDSFEVNLKRTIVETAEWWGKSALAIISVASSVLLALRALIRKIKKPIDK